MLWLEAREEAQKVCDMTINEAETLVTEARLQAEDTLFLFEKEEEALVEVEEKLNLATEDVLGYILNGLLF